MTRREWQNNIAADKPDRERSGGTGSMVQNSASMLAETGQAKPPVRKQIGKAKQDTRKLK